MRYTSHLWIISLLIGGLLTPHFSQSGQPAESRPLLQIIQKHLPEKLLKLEPGKSSESDIVKALGKAPESEKGILHYEVSGVKYDLSLEVENQTLKSYIYDFPSGSQLAFEAFNQWINDSKKQEIISEVQKQKGHNKGRYFYARFPKEGIELKFENGPKKKLKQVSVSAPMKTEQK